MIKKLLEDYRWCKYTEQTLFEYYQHAIKREFENRYGVKINRCRIKKLENKLPKLNQKIDKLNEKSRRMQKDLQNAYSYDSRRKKNEYGR